MAMNRWQELRDEITMRGRYQVTWVPSDDVLDEYESETGFQLPASYREFVKLFGGGQLAGDIMICCPGYTRGYRADVVELNEDVQDIEDEEIEALCNDCALYRRLHSFGFAGEHDDYFGWDPDQVSDPSEHDYAVFRVERRPRLIARIASTFEEFVRDICLGAGWATAFGHPWNGPSIGKDYPQMSFVPEPRD